MPASRMFAGRRRSSLGYVALGQPKYVASAVNFAPNITPTTFTTPIDEGEDYTYHADHAPLFPPSSTPAPPPLRRRVPPGKRRSLGYIPRPPNAFMLFRAEFVRAKHVPGSVETSHGSLSKIIGSCWRNLDAENRKVWELRAKKEKEEHKKRYPDYRFRPVHTKGKKKDGKEKAQMTEDEERRVEEVAQLLLQGKKGLELADAVRAAEAQRILFAPQPSFFPSTSNYLQPTYGTDRHRRSSSVPLPEMAMPSSLSFHQQSLTRPISPGRAFAYPRRPSSAGPAFNWTPSFDDIYQDSGPHILPDVNNSLFAPSFTFDTTSLSTAAPSSFANYVSPHDDLAPPQFASYPTSLDNWASTSTQVSYESSPALTNGSSLPTSAYTTNPSYPSGAPQTSQFLEADIWKSSLHGALQATNHIQAGPSPLDVTAALADYTNGLPSPYGMSSGMDALTLQNPTYYDYDTHQHNPAYDQPQYTHVHYEGQQQY